MGRTSAYLWSLRRQFAKYFTVGIIGVLIDIGTLFFFAELVGLSPVVSVVVNQAVTLTYSFLLNKYWSFRNMRMEAAQIIRYAFLMGFNYLFSVGVMYVGHERLGFHYMTVRVATIAAMVSWNFFLYKYWVYGEKIQNAKVKAQN